MIDGYVSMIIAYWYPSKQTFLDLSPPSKISQNQAKTSPNKPKTNLLHNNPFLSSTGQQLTNMLLQRWPETILSTPGHKATFSKLNLGIVCLVEGQKQEFGHNSIVPSLSWATFPSSQWKFSQSIPFTHVSTLFIHHTNPNELLTYLSLRGPKPPPNASCLACFRTYFTPFAYPVSDYKCWHHKTSAHPLPCPQGPKQQPICPPIL